MRTSRVMLTLSLALCALALSAPVEAQTSVAECKARIGLIQEDLDAIFSAGGIGGNNPTRTYESLASKLQGAAVKLDQQNKYGDALQKLQDFKIAVLALRDAAKPKLSTASAALLLDGDDDSDLDEGVNGAIACVALLP